MSKIPTQTLQSLRVGTKAILDNCKVQLIMQLGKLAAHHENGTLEVDTSSGSSRPGPMTISVHPEAELLQDSVVFHDKDGNRVPYRDIPFAYVLENVLFNLEENIENQ